MEPLLSEISLSALKPKFKAYMENNPEVTAASLQLKYVRASATSCLSNRTLESCTKALSKLCGHIVSMDPQELDFELCIDIKELGICVTPPQ